MRHVFSVEELSRQQNIDLPLAGAQTESSTPNYLPPALGQSAGGTLITGYEYHLGISPCTIFWHCSVNRNIGGIVRRRPSNACLGIAQQQETPPAVHEQEQSVGQRCSRRRPMREGHGVIL